jgi:hypothetical protein
MPGARCTRSLVCSVLVAHECSHHGCTGKHPAFPHAMVLTVSFVLSPVIGLSCHRRLRINACLNPVGPTCHRRLDAGVEASGPHDFTVRISIVRRRAVQSLTGNPPCDYVRARRCRVHRIPPPRS